MRRAIERGTSETAVRAHDEGSMLFSTKKKPHFRGLFLMGGTGLEPVTPSLSSWFRSNDTQRLTATNGRNHAGLRVHRHTRTAWLRRSISDRLAREWPTSQAAIR